MTRQTLKTAILPTIALTAVVGLAAPLVRAADVPGSKDHPALTRFAGAEIRAYEHKDYDAAWMPNQPIAQESTAKGLVLEGARTRISYRIDGSKSALEVYRNYQAALQAGGFTTVFACQGDAQCGGAFQSFVFNGDKMRMAYREAAFGGSYDVVLAKKEAPSGDLYVFLDVAEDDSNHRTLVFEQVLETKPLQTGQVKVLDKDAMQKSLAETGHVAVYGVYFDTDKAQVKPESKAALAEMGKLLKANPNLKVYVVGHTDNQGTLAGNLTLSQQRAEAVTKALETNDHIAAARLIPRGVASLAPVASNATEEGRAKNRRVELVSQ